MFHSVLLIPVFGVICTVLQGHEQGERNRIIHSAVVVMSADITTAPTDILYIRPQYSATEAIAIPRCAAVPEKIK
jgi:hypothetical protein